MPDLLDRVAHDDFGSGPALLLFHAFPLDRRMWDAQRAALAGRARVLRFDAPGFGGSAARPGALRMSDLAALGAALLDRHEVERAVVGGLSMGGYAALAFAREHPARLAGLLLADSRAGADGEEARANRLRQAEQVRSSGTAELIAGLLPKLLSPATLAHRPEVVEQVRSMASAAQAEGVAGALLGMAERPDATPGLAAITVPTMIVCGAEDTLTPPVESERLRDAIPGARLRLLAGAGHLANLEQPAAFTAAVVELLERVGA
jgi:pimeloyl-ACP methyl ester carboxylesterase